MSSREEQIFKAKILEQTERFEEMVALFTNFINTNNVLTPEERNLFSSAYKSVILTRRSVWRGLNALDQKEEAKGAGKHSILLKDYKKKIEDEMTKYCKDLFDILDKILIPKADTPEAIIFYEKMRADYLRYTAEYATGPVKATIIENTEIQYNKALGFALDRLDTTSALRLAISLNFSLFYYEVKNDFEKAISTAKQAYDDAVTDMEQVTTEEQYRETTAMMKLISDNFTLWLEELKEQGGEIPLLETKLSIQEI